MRNLWIVSISLLFSSPAWAAYYGVLDNGEVMAQGKYKATADVQALTDNGGVNAGASFDVGIDDEFGARGLLGFGKTDFYAGGMVKWMPIPDFESQPAMGLNAGLIYADDGNMSDLTFRLEPLVSKRIVIETTTLTPYVAVPIGMRMRKSERRDVDNKTEGTFQLVLGSQLQIEKWKNLQFIAEIGLDLEKAPGYISVGAVFYFDRENGFTLQ